MIKNATIPASAREDRYKEQVDHYLAETRKLLKQLATGRSAAARHRRPRTRIVEEVKAILHR